MFLGSLVLSPPTGWSQLLFLPRSTHSRFVLLPKLRSPAQAALSRCLWRYEPAQPPFVSLQPLRAERPRSPGLARVHPPVEKRQLGPAEHRGRSSGRRLQSEPPHCRAPLFPLSHPGGPSPVPARPPRELRPCPGPHAGPLSPPNRSCPSRPCAATGAQRRKPEAPRRK